MLQKCKIGKATKLKKAIQLGTDFTEIMETICYVVFLVVGVFDTLNSFIFSPICFSCHSVYLFTCLVYMPRHLLKDFGVLLYWVAA